MPTFGAKILQKEEYFYFDQIKHSQTVNSDAAIKSSNQAAFVFYISVSKKLNERSSHLYKFFKISVLENFAIFTGKHK